MSEPECDEVFQSIEFDARARQVQSTILSHAGSLLAEMDGLSTSRGRSLAVTKLEECVMWAGKAIRDDQIDRERAARIRG